MATFYLEQWFICFLTIFECTVHATTDILVIVGTTSNMDCSATQSVEWKFRAIGMRLPGFVYINDDITRPYKAGGRHDVKFNTDTGSSELVITNVMTSDAGTYTCTKEVGSNRVNTVFELTVLHSPPVCSSNISLGEVMIENDCNIEPDYVQLKCSILYSGNAVPVLRWNYSSEVNDRSGEWTNSNHFNRTETFLTFKASNQLCDKPLACAVQLAATSEPIECVLPRMSTQYFFRSDFQVVKLSKSDDALLDVKCSANTSCQECEYVWIKANNSESISDSDFKIRWSEVGPGSYKCVAKCQLRNHQCLAEPMLLEILEDDGTPVLFIASVVLVPIIVAILIVLGVVFYRRKYLMLKFRRQHEFEVEDEPLTQLLVEIVGTTFDEETLAKLIDNLDTNNGLAEYLRSKQVLSAEQYNEMSKESNWKSYQEQNRALLKIIFANNTTSSTKDKFIEALKETEQEHIAKYIQSRTSDRASPVETLEDPPLMMDDDLSRIDENLYGLVNLINSDDARFLDILVRKNCLTDRHLERIKEHGRKSAKNKELLSIIRRRSPANFYAFKIALWKTKQHGVLKLLENETGELFEIKCNLTTIESDSTSSLSSPTPSEIKELENKLCDLFTFSKHLTSESRKAVANCLIEIQPSLIHLIGASPTGSIVVYFLCETFQSILVFKQMLESGRMKKIIERLINSVLNFSSNQLAVSISWDKEHLNKCLDKARQKVLSDGHASASAYQTRFRKTEQITKETTEIIQGHAATSAYPSRSRKFAAIPKEITEIILYEASVHLMKILWKEYLEENKTNFDASSSNFESYKRKILYFFKQVSILMSSVSFEWKEIFSKRRTFRNNIVKEFVIFNIGLNKQFLVTTLNVKHGFMNMLEESKVITNDERQEIRDDVGQLLKHLRTKKYTQIMSFLHSLEDTQQSHVLNYVLCQAEYSPSHRHMWPIDSESMIRIYKNFTKLVNSINPTIHTEEIMAKTKLRSSSSLEDSGTFTKLFFDDRNLPTKKSLFDVLYSRRCISVDHKGLIELHRNIAPQSTKLLQLLLKGSVEAFRTTGNYLEETGQQSAAKMLSEQSFDFIGDVRLSGYERVTGITWINDRFYLVFDNSNKIVKYRFAQLFGYEEDGEIEVPDMISPCDIISSLHYGSVVVGDEHSQCLWRISIGDGDESNVISKWQINHTMKFLSSADEDSFLVITSSSSSSLSLSSILLEHSHSKRNVFSVVVHNFDDGQIIETIPLPDFIQQMWHAVQISSGHYLISYEMRTRKNSMRVVSRINKGGNIIRTFVLSQNNQNIPSMPIYIALAENDQAYIADDNKIFHFDGTQIDKIFLEVVGLNISHASRVCWFAVHSKETLAICQSGDHPSFSIWNRTITAKKTHSEPASYLRKRFVAAERNAASDPPPFSSLGMVAQE